MKVKICGITNDRDANMAANLGADYLGFILYKGSPRYVASADIKRIVSSLANQNVKKVGVFVDEEPIEIINIMNEAGLDIAQLHSVKDDKTYNLMTKASVPYLRVVRVEDNDVAFEKDNRCYGYLFDTYLEDQYGGTGKPFNWNAVKDLSKDMRIFLSGGLNEFNVKEAIAKVKPYAVDISSGVEESPGKKNPLRMELFILAAKGLI